MNNDQIIATFEKWQKQVMEGGGAVYVMDFTLRPQAKGFYLNVEAYVAGESYDTYHPSESFFGSVSECVEQALAWLEAKRVDLQAKLDASR